MELVGLVGMSHSPSWDLSPVEGAAKPYVDAVFRARDEVARLMPDVLVVFGPDHVRNFFFDLMPAFCIGVENVTGFGDYSSPKGPFATCPDLASFIAEQVLAAGFDPALSHNMGIDHGISQPVAALVPDLRTPVIPIMISSGGAPLPTLARCHAFGSAVGDAIRAFPGKARALVVGSGGLSHSPPSISPADPGLSAETRDYLINGRPRVQEFNRQREEASRKRRGVGGIGPINEEWDRWLLDCMRTGDLAPVLAMDNATLLEQGGVGGQEIRAWLAALGAWGKPAETTDYAPVPTWITGMGCATAFDKEAV
ncbi:2,3-dihydroxyphenylpropionate 1,2-dioxygenase [Sphingomonas sp. CL5.1]|uniref:DODA-type extradiol aromatic ring-opening family dioxygenase n=1 Tax=Sphingomonas sp. CL5.1 TaxID=2653203 RepID=UPI001581BBD8|nr:2,3-dihydroxyphenylpropionate 1,2-dioxygenase [Sphingomonas sp. CL5.1]QKS00238.1 2,3-dihydroxyphenylpropionate 1,2-dioxygenase [Sphingomonas sp. CL5.1]